MLKTGVQAVHSRPPRYLDYNKHSGEQNHRCKSTDATPFQQGPVIHVLNLSSESFHSHRSPYGADTCKTAARTYGPNGPAHQLRHCGEI